MVPILLGLILVVGAIRLYPWLMAKLMPVERVELISPSLTQNEAKENSAEESTAIVAVDTSTPEILSANVKVVTEQRSEALTDIIQQPAPAIVAPQEVAPVAELSFPEPKIVSTPVLTTDTDTNIIAQLEQPVALITPIETPVEMPVEPVEEVVPDLPSAENSSEKEVLVDTAPDEPSLDSTPEAIAPTAIELAVNPELAEQLKNSLAEASLEKTSDTSNSIALVSPEAQIRKAIIAWQLAWATQNTKNYFASYTEQYTDKKSGRRTHKQWRKWRKKRVLKPAFIEINVADVAVEIEGKAEKASAQFKQTYRAPNYQDRVLKRLDLIKVDGLWKIKGEATIKVLPLG